MGTSLLQTAYSHLPVPMQNFAFSLWGVKTRRERYGKAFRERLDWLKTTEWWSEDEIEAYQNDQIRRLVEHADVTVPAYRDRMNAASL